MDPMTTTMRRELILQGMAMRRDMIERERETARGQVNETSEAPGRGPSWQCRVISLYTQYSATLMPNVAAARKFAEVFDKL